jgi:ribosomal protein L7/L12
MNTSQPSAEQRLLELKVEGTTPIEAIKELHLAYGLSLAEAKHLFSLSPAWSEEASAGEQLHQEIAAVLARREK